MNVVTGQSAGPAVLPPPVASNDWRRMILMGHAILIGSLGLFVGWAALSRLDGAAVAPGVVSVETNRKTVQHLEGGIIRDLLVRDGDLVQEGQILVRLDPTRLNRPGVCIAISLRSSWRRRPVLSPSGTCWTPSRSRKKSRTLPTSRLSAAASKTSGGSSGCVATP
jgi:hypothetical protein